MADDQAKAVGDALRALLAKAAAGLVLEVTANLIEACPVATGHARANFIPSVSAPTDAVDGDASGLQAAGQVAVAAYKLGDGDLFISNNVPYIDKLIAGSSTQAPAGWDLVAVDEAQQTIQAQYDSLDIDVTAGPAGLAATISPRTSGA